MADDLNEEPKYSRGAFLPVVPWSPPPADDCIFYHYMDMPGGETIKGAWDIRGRFEQYIGGVSLTGKTVLDVGTASGFLSFEAEKVGATVTAIEARDAREFKFLQFFDSLDHVDRASWERDMDGRLVRLKNSFWYAHHKLGSHVEAIYAPIDAFPFWERRFDVVIAGAIIEHISDPVSAIGNIARLAKEKVVIAFTPVEDSDELIMRTANDWSSRHYCYTWWILSRGLFRRVFENVGFNLEFKPATATVLHEGVAVVAERSTIIATRI